MDPESPDYFNAVEDLTDDAALSTLSLLRLGPRGQLGEPPARSQSQNGADLTDNVPYSAPAPNDQLEEPHHRLLWMDPESQLNRSIKPGHPRKELDPTTVVLEKKAVGRPRTPTGRTRDHHGAFHQMFMNIPNCRQIALGHLVSELLVNGWAKDSALSGTSSDSAPAPASVQTIPTGPRVEYVVPDRDPNRGIEDDLDTEPWEMVEDLMTMYDEESPDPPSSHRRALPPPRARKNSTLLYVLSGCLGKAISFFEQQAHKAYSKTDV
ncbi:hypothetical protein DFH09DRAFT_1272761 [Mycena vulgaris]|nr:hypothetical protein DFH09DRAFT_1272761 [Mycena vulgaris]